MDLGRRPRLCRQRLPAPAASTPDILPIFTEAWRRITSTGGGEATPRFFHARSVHPYSLLPAEMPLLRFLFPGRSRRRPGATIPICFADISNRRAVRGWHGPFATVFFGGGTPSLLPPAAVGSILETAARHFGIAADAEISLEANPGTVTLDQPHRLSPRRNQPPFPRGAIPQPGRPAAPGAHSLAAAGPATLPLGPPGGLRQSLLRS